MNEFQDLSGLSLDQLLAAQDEAALAAAAAKGMSQRLSQELQRRYGESAKQALSQAGKDHGSISLPLQDGFVAKAEMKQTVKWDSDALLELAQTLPWERVRAIFTIKFSMAEKVYAGIAAFSPEMRAKIDAARTTTIAEPAITLSRSN